MCESTSRSSVVEEGRSRTFVARKSGTLIEQPVELLPRIKSNKSQLITWQRSCCCFGDGGRNVFSACWFRGSYFDVRDRMQRILVEFFTDARWAVTNGALVWIADDCCDSDWRRYARIECIQSQSRDRCCRLDGDVDEYRFDSAYVDLGRQRVELRNGRARTAVQFHVRLERHVSLPLRDSSGDGGDGDRPVKGCHRCRCYWKTLLSARRSWWPSARRLSIDFKTMLAASLTTRQRPKPPGDGSESWHHLPDRAERAWGMASTRLAYCFCRAGLTRRKAATPSGGATVQVCGFSGIQTATRHYVGQTYPQSPPGAGHRGVLHQRTRFAMPPNSTYANRT